MLPMNVQAKDRTHRNWWPEQIDEWDEYYDEQVTGQWPDAVVTNEIAVNTILFRTKILAAQKLNKTVKVLVDATTAARNIVVEYTVDGKRWEHKSYRNVGYKGPVICTRKWQYVLHTDNRSTSKCLRQFKQGSKTIDFKQTYCRSGYSAQLFFDDQLIDHTIRPKVIQPVLLNVPAKAKRIKIRYVYDGLHKTCFSDWQEVKVAW